MIRVRSDRVLPLSGDDILDIDAGEGGEFGEVVEFGEDGDSGDSGEDGDLISSSSPPSDGLLSNFIIMGSN